MNGQYCRHCGQPIRQVLAWVHDRDGATGCQPCDGPAAAPHPAPTADDAALDRLRRDVGDRWHISPVIGGYAAMPRHGGSAPAPRYGRTPGELAESIRFAEGRL